MDAYIADTVRTPRGKAKASGGLGQVKPLELLTTLFEALETRQEWDTAEINDVIIGCATQTGEQGGNIAKVAALMAGWGDHIPGLTVNRFCASGLEAVNLAAAKIHSGIDSLVVAGGVESVSRVPMFADKGPLYTDPAVIAKAGFIHMGIAADLIATLEGFERAELDAYAVRTHQRAAAAHSNGHFSPSLVTVHDQAGLVLLDRDEHIRPGTTAEQLADMEPAFAEMGAQGMDEMALARYPHLPAIRHLHHRGNSPALADGAGVVLVGRKEKLRELGLRPRAKIRSIASHSVDPITMLTAGQIAAERALRQAGLTANDVDLFEFAEAFAALCLKFQRDLRVEPERFNVNGGTIAMGHAFGATGAILLATLLDELERQDKQMGVVAVSGAAGLGVATVIERV
jgi:acetyl-CoA C-acetyltransferase